jgi:hypothetical protein
MRGQIRTWTTVLIAACLLSACTSLGFPRRGFLTRYFAGSDLQKSITTSDDLAGRPFHPAIESYTGPAPVGRRANESTSLARTESTCMGVAHQRALDAASQGFGEATQKTVFDSTYRDCAAWRQNH